jgi:CRP-like cAMP-binding protein
MSDTHKHEKIHCETCASRSLGVLCRLDAPAIHLIDTQKVTNLYRRKQVLFYEGQTPTGVYCVATGAVKLYKTGADGRVLIVRTAKAGDMVGYRSLLTGEKYDVTAEMTEEGEVCFIDKTTLVTTINENPKMAMDVIRRLGGEMGNAESKLREFSQKSVGERLAELLLKFKDAVGRIEKDGATLLDQRISRDEIAQMLGSSSETIIRALRQFADDGLIRLEGKQIFIADLPGLTEAARLEN